MTKDALHHSPNYIVEIYVTKNALLRHSEFHRRGLREEESSSSEFHRRGLRDERRSSSSLSGSHC